MSDLKKPGEVANPGEYIERGPQGGKVPGVKPVTITPKEKLPPTTEPNHRWERISPPKKK